LIKKILLQNRSS